MANLANSLGLGRFAAGCATLGFRMNLLIDRLAPSLRRRPLGRREIAAAQVFIDQRQFGMKCIEVLAKQQADPGHTLAQGPILEIIRSVKNSLDALPGETMIGHRLLKAMKEKGAPAR